MDSAEASTAGEDGSPEIDACFVVPPQHRPSVPATALDSLPVIDLAPLLRPQAGACASDKAALKSLVDEVGHACEAWGFFQLINHGIPPSLIYNLKEVAKDFFALPLETKLQVKRTFENALGYNDGELTKNVRDWKEVFDMSAEGSFELPADFFGDDHVTRTVYNQWPSCMPRLRQVCEEYSSAVKKLALLLLDLIGQSLRLPANHFHDHFAESKTTRLRLNHYPVCHAPQLALGVSRHKDVGALTVLLQDDVGGLEVKRKDGTWIPVKPNPAALIVNVGDLIQVYSNDKYQSVEHRVVVNENTDRFSFPLFCNPAHWVKVSPVAKLPADSQQAPRYKPIQWGKYIKSRMDSNFKHLGVENLQIADFAINSQ